MPQKKHNFKKDDDFFKIDLSYQMQHNKRTAVRYVRNDIATSVIKKGFIRTYKVKAKLVNIGSKGAMVICSLKLSAQQRVTLCLTFQDGKFFSIAATVVHSRKTRYWHYGLKFDAYNHALGDHLLSSQCDLIFN